jgi:hypothetical protein
MRGLLRFDLSDIPAGASVTSARFYLVPQDDRTGQATYLYRLTSGWSESSATWSSPWLEPGGDFGDSFSYAQILNEQKNCAIEVNITGLVQAWVDGDFPNYGILLSTEGSNPPMRYTAKEDSANPEEAPRLLVSYTTGSRQSPDFFAFLWDWLGAFLGLQ